jgi:YfiH family protein
VRALTTLRGPLGGSQGAYARFNLGARAGDDLAVVHDNRCLLADGAELPSWPHWLQQVHGTRVHAADARLPRPSRLQEAPIEPEADAAVSAVRGVVLAILSADCLPVLFAARDGSVVAAAHAGWRGLAACVLEATIAALCVAPADLLAWIGPGIGADSYEVDARVHAAFVDADAGGDAAQAFRVTRPGHWHCDLAALARMRMQRAGLAAVHGGAYDTFRDARFYSYRRDGADSGRMATLIWREG